MKKEAKYEIITLYFILEVISRICKKSPEEVLCSARLCYKLNLLF